MRFVLISVGTRYVVAGCVARRPLNEMGFSIAVLQHLFINRQHGVPFSH